MAKPIFIFLLILYCCQGRAQSDYIVLKKGKKSIQHFWKDSHITFQLQDGQWLRGIITGIRPDSFYFKQEIIRFYLTGADTFHVSGFAFSLKDIYALPARRQIAVYENDPVKVIPGHERFLWIRNGFIFRVAGAGYVGLNLANHLIQGDPPFERDNLTRLGIGTAVFLLGEILHLRFYPYLRMGKKYRLEIVVLQRP
jgi:hypothetical protein